MSIITFFRAVNFKKLPFSEIAIIHSHDFWIRKFILREVRAVTLPIYPEAGSIYINYELLKSLFFDFVNILEFIRIIFSNRESNLFKCLYIKYLILCLNQMGVKIAITFIDNSSIFQSLDLNDNKSNRVYLAVQNGTRTLSCVGVSNRIFRNEEPKIFLSNYYCFGDRDLNLFKSNSHNILNYFPVGSLLGSEYGKSIVSQSAKKYDLCYISQWQEYFNSTNEYLSTFIPNGSKVRESVLLLNELVKKVVECKQFKVIIAFRTRDPLEEQFYYRVFGDKVDYCKFERNKLSSFQAVNISQLTLAMNSTMLAEVFSWGTKVLWCNTINDEIFAMPEAGICYFTGNQFNQFFSKIMLLIGMSDELFIHSTSLNAAYINNPNISVGDIIRKRVITELES